MKYFLSFLLLLPWTASCSNQPTQNRIDVIEDRQSFSLKVDALVQRYLDLGIFSGVVLVAEGPDTVYHRAFGMANREERTPNTTQTRFDIGSMNKSMTKVVVLQLVREGKIKLDATLDAYLSGFAEGIGNKVTVQHLLEHSSGLGDYHSPDYFNAPIEKKDLAFRVETIRQMDLHFEPGTEQQYSNAGFVLLGAIIEAVTGNRYEEEVERRIIRPLGMINTHLGPKSKAPRAAVGYLLELDGSAVSNDYIQEQPGPDGGFYSTAADMMTFYRAYHYGDRLWDASTRSLDEMASFYTKHQSTGGAMSHAGGFDGANTVCYEILRDHISVLVFANMDEPVAENLGAGILAIIRGQEPEEPALPARLAVFHAYQKHGISYIAEHFEDLTKNFHPADPKDLILNNLGYQLLFDGRTADAIALFKLNTELFPDVANTWDSYGESLLKNGDKPAAKAAYEHALQLDPNLPSAKAALRKLKH